MGRAAQEAECAAEHRRPAENPVDRLQDQKVINAACTHSGSPGMPDRDECDWDLAELNYMGHLEVNIAPWKGSVLLHRVDEPAEAQNY